MCANGNVSTISSLGILAAYVLEEQKILVDNCEIEICHLQFIQIYFLRWANIGIQKCVFTPILDSESADRPLFVVRQS